MTSPATPKHYPNPFWKQGTYQEKVGISGFITGQPYKLDLKTQQVFKKLNGSWVLMTDVQCQRPKYNIRDVLNDKYVAAFNYEQRLKYPSKRKQRSIDATRQANQRSIGS